MDYKSNNNVVYSCKYHVVWCPKYRRKVLTGEVERRLKELVVDVCGEIHVDVIEMEIMPDHVHLLIEVDPQYGIHKAVKLIKGRTSHHLRKEEQHTALKITLLIIAFIVIFCQAAYSTTTVNCPLSTVHCQLSIVHCQL